MLAFAFYLIIELICYKAGHAGDKSSETAEI